MSYDIDFIGSLIADVVEKGKTTNVRLFKKAENKVNYYPNYQFKIELMEKIKNHSELNAFPEKLFIAKAPRQTPEELNYIKENYKQVTLPVYLDFLSTISRIFNDTNYSIDYKEIPLFPNESSFQSYVENELPIYGSLENFIKFVLPHIKLNDANGIIAIKPYEINYTETETGEQIVDDSLLFEPYPVYYSSKQIVAEKPDEYYLIELNETSPVEYYGRIQNVGKVYEFYDDSSIYRITQIGKASDNNFTIELLFNHNWEEIPAIKLQGVPTLKEGELMYVSPFSYAVDLLDLVTINASYLQVVINNCVFPFRVMYGDICEFEYMDSHSERSICSSGWVYDSSMGRQITCPSCNGTGLRSRVSPLGVMLLKPKTNLNEGDSGLQQNPIEYVEPSTNTSEFLLKKIENDEQKARKILHLTNTNSNVSTSPKLATEMVLDLKALYAFLKPISDQIFTIWEFISNAIGYQRYGERFIAPVFQYPVNFDFNTEADYTAQINEAVKAGLPPFVLQTILWKYLKSIYFTEKSTANVFNLIYNTDRLLPFTSDEIAMKQARGNLSKWEIVLHDSAISFVDSLMSENPEFFNQSLQLQQEQLIQKAKDKVDEIEGKVKVDTTNVVQSIMNASSAIADQQNVDQIFSEEEAKAQAQLKGSVGGVQGIIEIQNSVTKGITTKESALAMLELVYGFNAAEAERLIGDPASIQDIQGATGSNVNVSV